jgi:mannose-6-phosphate isomerase-like protein (cupin superfamily)
MEGMRICLHERCHRTARSRVDNDDPTTAAIRIPAEGGESFDFGGLGVHWKIDADVTDGRFSVVHHPLAPHAVAAPLHRHHNEDEYSYVLEGKLGALLGDEVVVAEAGSWVFKPRGQWHPFWNAGDTPCHIIEVISPGGFEDYFRKVAAAWGDVERSPASTPSTTSTWTSTACRDSVSASG